jgi:hypothetical protein
VRHGIVTGNARHARVAVYWTKAQSKTLMAPVHRQIGRDRTAGACSRAANNMTVDVHHQPTLVDKLRHELVELGIISLYIYICLSAIMLYKTALLRKYSIDFTPFGIAGVKSLIIAKFIMLGHTFRLGEKQRGKPLTHFIAIQVALFAALVIALSVLEEIVVALLHHRPVAEVFVNIENGDWLLILADAVLLCLFLTPYIGLRAINDSLEPGRLHRMFFGENR